MRGGTEHRLPAGPRGRPGLRVASGLGGRAPGQVAGRLRRGGRGPRRDGDRRDPAARARLPALGRRRLDAGGGHLRPRGGLVLGIPSARRRRHAQVGMRLTARRLNRATLARQLLLRREPLEVAEAVRRRRRCPDPAPGGVHGGTPHQRGVRGAAERAARRGPAEGVVGAAHVRAGGARRDRGTVVLRLPAVLPRRAAPGPGAGRPGGSVLFDVPGAPLPGEDTPCPPRLMAMWDSVLLAYADRSRVIPPAYRALVIRRNGDVLPTLLVDGHVAGVWRPAGGGIEATAFRELTERAWQELAEEARALVSFLAARDPAVYRRFAHWWKELPAAEVRFLPG